MQRDMNYVYDLAILPAKAVYVCYVREGTERIEWAN